MHIDRGLPPKLAGQVASTLTNGVEDPAAAHARDRDGVDAANLTSPVQAAAVSLLAFSLGGAAPLATAALVANDAGLRSASVAAVSLLTLVRRLVPAAPPSLPLRERPSPIPVHPLTHPPPTPGSGGNGGHECPPRGSAHG